MPKTVSDEPTKEYVDDQPQFRDEALVRLARLQSDMTALRDDVLALHAALADIQRRLRLIAGF